jgi:hypothetical protein
MKESLNMMTHCVEGIRTVRPEYLILFSTEYSHKGPSPNIRHWYYQCLPRMYKTHDMLNMPLSEEWLLGDNQFLISKSQKRVSHSYNQLHESLAMGTVQPL